MESAQRMLRDSGLGVVLVSDMGAAAHAAVDAARASAPLLRDDDDAGVQLASGA